MDTHAWMCTVRLPRGRRGPVLSGLFLVTWSGLSSPSPAVGQFHSGIQPIDVSRTSTTHEALRWPWELPGSVGT